MAIDYSKVSSGMVNPGAAVGTALSTLASALPTKSEQIQMSMMKTIENELIEPMKLLGKDPSTYTDLTKPVKDAFSLYTDWKNSLSPSEQEIAMRNNINAMTFGNAYQQSATSIGGAISKKIQDFGNKKIYTTIGMSKNLAPFLKSVDPLAMDYLITPETTGQTLKRAGKNTLYGIVAGGVAKFGLPKLMQLVTSKLGAKIAARTVATLVGGAATGGIGTLVMAGWLLKDLKDVAKIIKEETSSIDEVMPPEEQPVMTKSREDILKSLYELKK